MNELLLIIGGLAVLLIIVLIVSYARQKSARPAKPIEPAGPDRPVTVTAPAAPAVVTLEFPTTTGPSIVYTLSKPMLALGRAQDNDIVVPESVANYDTVSLHHAQLRRDREDYVLRDLGSRNGTMVNDRHTAQNLLQDGDRLSFGTAQAVFHRPSGGQHEVR